ncbi:MAG: thioredoxin family protein [Candidatus Nanoarchaeia archaeon]|jgi:glutaredoxin
MKIKIFTQPNCPNCPAAKILGQELLKEGADVEFYDIKTPQGLTESIMHNVLSTPSVLILNNEEVIAEFLSQAPKIEEVKKWL